MKQLNIAVVGVGYVGNIHARNILALDGVKLRCVVDINPARAKKVGNELSVPFYTVLSEELLKEIDAAVVAVPANEHYQVAKRLVENGKHILIEKPFVTSVEEGEELIDLAHKMGTVIAVGHSERFNPVTSIIERELTAPGFIEGDRLSPFTNRCLDVDVVLDLMIHDLDLLAHLISEKFTDIDAVGVPVLTGKVDIANVRIVTENGCVINLTASRVSDKKMRKMRFFQPDSYVSVDFLIPRVSVKKRVIHDGRMHILSEEYMPEENDPLHDEILDFVEAVKNGKKPTVPAEDAMKPVKLAVEILNRMRIPLNPMRP